MNIGDIKKELQRLGLSTNTPGLLGDERYEELKFRLEKALASAEFESSLQSSVKQRSTDNNGNNDDEFKKLNFELLTIGELRSRLTSLGISTNTPGLSGQERFEALKKRLIEAICNQQNDEEEEEEKDQEGREENNQKPSTQSPNPPPQNLRRPPSAPPVDDSPIIPQSSEEIEELTDEQAVKLVSIPQSEISELKKQQKRINNKRSLYIASQFSGSSQDEQLKDYNLELSNIEADITRCRGAEQRGEKTIYLKQLKTDLQDIFQHSSFTLDEFNVETLQVINTLEALKTQLKELIKERRNEIRVQAERNQEFGLHVEEKLQYEINRAVLINNRINRARQKLSLSGASEKKPIAQEIPRTESQDKKGSTHATTSSLPSVKPSPPQHKPTAVTGDKKSTTPIKIDVLPEITPDRHSGEKSRLRDSFGFRSEFLGKDLNFDHPTSSSKDQQATKEENEDNQSMKNLDYFLDPKLKESLAIMKAESKDWNDVILKSSPLQNKEEEKFPVRNNRFVASEDDEDEDEEEEEEEEQNEDEVLGREEEREQDQDQDMIITNDDLEEVFRSKSASSSTIPRMLSDSRSTSSMHASPPSGKQSSPAIEKLGSQSSVPSLPSIDKNYFTFSQSNDSTDEYFTRDLVTEDGLLTEKQQIIRLRKYAKKLEKFDDYQAAEVLYERALEIEPTDIVTLQLFALFLQQKKGELSRAEAFFNRALQTCLPNLHLNISTPNKKKMLMKQSSYLRLLHETGESNSPDNTQFHQPPHHSEQLNVMDGYKLSDVIHLLTSFSNFMLKSKGDIEAAYLLLEKSMILAPENASTLAHYAHFLAEHQSEEFFNTFYLPEYLTQALLQQKQRQEEKYNNENGPKPPSLPPPMNEEEFLQMKEEEKKLKKQKRKEERFQKLDILFRYALKYQPGQVTYMMWYGKFLKKSNKLGPAELLYKSALEFSRGNKKVEPTAICNFATFLLKKRKNYVKAEELFLEGLENFPNHKGLRKNFGALIKILEKQKEKEANGDADENEEEEDEEDEGDSEEDEDDRHGRQQQQQQERNGKRRGSGSRLDTEEEETEEDDEDEDDDEDEEEEGPRRRNGSKSKGRALKSPPPRPPKHLPAETRLMLLPTSPDRQKRGTKRASRVQQSLLSKLPEHVESTESKADFIMRMMNQAFQKK